MVDTVAAVVTPLPDPSGGAASRQQALQEQRAPQRAAAIEALKAARAGADPAAIAPVVEPAAVAAPAADLAPDIAAEDSATESPAADAVPAVVPPAEVEPPGMAAVRKAEQHARRQLAQERAALLADLDGQKAAWQTKIEKAAAIEARIAKAKDDPISAMTALGFGEADFEALGRLLYAHSPEGQKDPRHKIAAAQTLAQREAQATAEKLQARIDALEQGLTAKEQAAQAQARANEYVASVTSAVSDETPLTKAALAKAPAKTQAALFQVALRLYNESGPTDDLRDDPTPAEVLRAYESQRIAELEELGIDPKTIGRKPAPPAPPARPAATLAPAGAGAPVPTRVEGPPDRNDVLAQLAKFRNSQ